MIRDKGREGMAYELRVKKCSTKEKSRKVSEPKPRGCPTCSAAHCTQKRNDNGNVRSYLYSPRVRGAFSVRCSLVVEVRALERAAHQKSCLQLIHSLGCVLLLNESENLLPAAVLTRLNNEAVADFPHEDNQPGRCVVVLAVFPDQ